MKKCNNCQTECTDDAVFCPKCGERLESEMEQKDVSDIKETVIEKLHNDMPEVNQILQEMKRIGERFLEWIKKNKKLIIGAILVFMLMIASVTLMKNKKYTIDLEDFYEVEFSGANKYSYATGDFDDNAIMDYILETSDRDDDISEFSNYMIVDWIISNVDTTMSKSENLKNGDKIKVTFEYPKGAKVKGYRIKGKSIHRKWKQRHLPFPLPASFTLWQHRRKHGKKMYKTLLEHPVCRKVCEKNKYKCWEELVNRYCMLDE